MAQALTVASPLYRLFDDWTLLVEVCLEALPEQLKGVAQTGRFAQNTPETVELFNQIRATQPSVADEVPA